MKKKGKLYLLTTLALVLCLSLGGCFTILNTVLDNLNTVFSLLDPSVEEGSLPEGTVYGSKNDLAVGFDDGSLYAFWDDKGEYDYALSVNKDGVTTAYDTDKDDELFVGTTFDLEGAGYRYSDDLTLRLSRISLNPDYDEDAEGSEEYLYGYSEYAYSGLSASDYKTYVKNVPGGFTTIDYYVASRYELFELFAYLVIFRPNVKPSTDRSGTFYTVDVNFKMGYDYAGLYGEDVGRSGAYEAEIKCAVASFEDSAGYSYGYEIDKNDVGNLYLKFGYAPDPKKTTDTASDYANATSRSERAHYSTSRQHTRTFPIDKIERTVSVSTGDQLYFAIKKGYRPVPVVGSNAYYLYNRMRAILSYINEDSYSAVKKVHMIYDYIVNTVIYDYNFTDNVIDSVTGAELFSYKCLYLEGVFGLTNKQTFDSTQCVAICDGLSKAFLCMARIEGLNAIKISGVAMTAYGKERGAHAWNKIEIDDKWYLVDTTWGNQLSASSSSSSSGRSWLFPFYSGDTSGSSSSKQQEYLSHDYCLVPDDNKHEEDPWYSYPAAENKSLLL
ncbi:MAG: hypothetical protein IJ735_06055 [Clostridia bacterium]|nr:hypothetical protein [Clostridia bacterium]